ncbi:MAG: hypothetical protein ACJAU1_001375 [Psychromonas sp.]|jgi:hypothetical protein
MAQVIGLRQAYLNKFYLILEKLCFIARYAV